jgi:hypothetical protein
MLFWRTFYGWRQQYGRGVPAFEIGYPAWQIEENSTLPHLEEVLEALKDHYE